MPAIALTDEQLREAWSDLDQPLAFEVARQNPLLVVCMRARAEQRLQRHVVPAAVQSRVLSARRFVPRDIRQAALFDPKRAAANDRDDD